MQGVGERLEDAGRTSYKTAIKVYRPEEPLKLTNGARPGVLLESDDTMWQWGDAAAGDPVTR